MSTELQKLESWRKDLALVETFDELKLIGDAAIAYQDLMRKQKVAKIKQDEVGEFIIEVEEHKGRWLNQNFPHGATNQFRGNQYESGKVEGADLTKMPASKDESARARRLLETREQNPDLYESAKQEIKDSDAVLTPYTLDSVIKCPHVANNSGENEWYTPPQYIESARKVMGSIDLDPASSNLANEIVQADEYYTKTDNGLDFDWHGNIWLNPPYAQPLISQFARAVVENREQYNQAIILVNNATETNWLQSMLSISDAVCFPKGRVRFIDINGNPGAPLQGQIILYIGVGKLDFIDEFRKYGTCMIRV